MKVSITILSTLIVSLLISTVASAHVVVTPKTTGVGERTLFTVSVPNERDTDVKQIKLDIPNGLESVQPNVIAGWKISTKTDNEKNVSSITWKGDIPAGQRADLAFKAQAPATATDLKWNAYQTYADGVTVEWNQTPSSDAGHDDETNAGPYSVTSVIEDTDASTNGTDTKGTLALYISILALIFCAGLFMMKFVSQR